MIIFPFGSNFINIPNNNLIFTPNNMPHKNNIGLNNNNTMNNNNKMTKSKEIKFKKQEEYKRMLDENVIIIISFFILGLKI